MQSFNLKTVFLVSGLINPLKMTDSKYFTTTKKGEIFELKSELNNDKKEKKKEAVKKVYFLLSSLASSTYNV